MRSRKGFLFLLIMLCSCGEEPVTVPGPHPLSEGDTLFITVPGGSFTNSFGETVEVESFQLMKNEVNNRLYRYLADRAGVSHPPDPGFDSSGTWFYDSLEHPVVNVSPSRARKTALEIGCRLPTRDEWEYAASQGLVGDISVQYPWGELSPEEVPGVPANYMALDNWNERELDGFAATAPCGSYPLSASGFADVAGNAAEMTFCTRDSTIHLMGGSWAQAADAMKFGFTRVFPDGDISWYAGFRLAR